MQYSAESAVFHSAFQLFERQVLSANLELENLTKKDCHHFIHIIRKAVEEICEGLQEKHYPFTKQLWHFNLNLILFLKLFSQQKLQNQTEKLYEKVPCKDDLLIIVAPLPYVSTAFYFELIKTCNWNLLFTECVSLLNPEEIQKWMVCTIQHCKELPQSADDLFLLSALIKTINETCLPEEIQEFWPKHKETGISTDMICSDFNLTCVREMLCDHSQIILDLLNSVAQLLISASEEAKTSNSLFWKAHEPSQFDDIFFDLTLLGIAVYGDFLEIEITPSDLFTTEGLYNLNKGQLSDLTQNMKEWLKKDEDIVSLSDLYASAAKYSSFKVCQFRIQHLKSLDLKCLGKIIFVLYLYFKCWSISGEDRAMKDQKLLSAFKFCSLCEMLVSKSRLHLSNEKESSSDNDSSENGVIDQVDFILEQLKNYHISFDEVVDISSLEENILPEEKLAEMLKDENLESWKDERFFIFIEGHSRELSNPNLFRSLWEQVNWLANIAGEAHKKLTEKYVKVLLDSFSFMDPLLQDYLIYDFYLPVKCETDRPWWRRSSCFQQQLTVSLNKLTERNFTKIPNRISQYALLDFETVLRTSIFTAINNACQVDVIAQLLKLLPVSCKISSFCDNTDDKGTKNMKSLSLLEAELDALLVSGKLDANQQNAFLELVTQLIKPVSTGVRKQFGVRKYLISLYEVFHFLILPRLHLCLTFDADHPNPLFILKFLIIALKSDQMQQSTSIENLHLHVVLLQICHALNDTINCWKEVDKRETSLKMKPLLISAVSLLEEIILKNLPSEPDKVLQWLSYKLSILDWTVQLRLRKLLFFYHQNSGESLQLCNEIIMSFLRTQEIRQSCDLQQTLHLLRIASIDEEIGTSIMQCLPSYILFSRDCVTVAIGQLLPNLLSEEMILVCQFLMHLIENSQLIVLCQVGFLPSIPCLDLSVLKSYLGLSQLFMDVIVLHSGLDNVISQYIFDNIFSSIKTVLLSPAVFSKMNPMLSLLFIYQLFSVVNILINIVGDLNVDKILLFLVELITIFKQHFSMFYPVPKKRKRGITKSEESEPPHVNALEFNLNETMIAAVNNDVSSESGTTSSSDKFFIALILELLNSMIDQINHLSNYEIKSSILITLDEMKIPFLKVCRKIE